MSLDFGKKVCETADDLKAQGRDANQIAKILFDRDPEGNNYGIGIVLDNQGQPMSSSSLLLQYAKAELELCKPGNYMSSAKLAEALKVEVLKWQRIPETYWENFQLILPSDAGTGAVKTAVEVELLENSNIDTIGIEENGWPAYKTIAKTARVGIKDFPGNGNIAEEGVLPIYQAGPMNTTGEVRSSEVIKGRAAAAKAQKTSVILDRAYSGFEFARLLESESYDEVMRKSYELQIQPFLEEGVPFCMSLSPTKAFITFAFRPCGMLLVYRPDLEKKASTTALLNSTIRARGSSFEHPITRAFVKAMTENRAGLEAEHLEALHRVAEAEKLWRELVQGTKIEYLYSESYAGLFRNPNATPEAAANIYNAHVYPVFANNRCRQNVTGIPSDETLAKKHVAIFAEHCY